MRLRRFPGILVMGLALAGLAAAATARRPPEANPQEAWLTLERGLEMITMLAVALVGWFLRRVDKDLDAVRTLVRNESQARVAQIEALRSEVRQEGAARLSLEREERVARQRMDAELLKEIHDLDRRLTRQEANLEALQKGAPPP